MKHLQGMNLYKLVNEFTVKFCSTQRCNLICKTNQTHFPLTQNCTFYIARVLFMRVAIVSGRSRKSKIASILASTLFRESATTEWRVAGGKIGSAGFYERLSGECRARPAIRARTKMPSDKCTPSSSRRVPRVISREDGIRKRESRSSRIASKGTGF